MASAPGRSLLSRDQILRHMREGNIFISPFDVKDLKTTSYDIRLGENYFHEQPFRATEGRQVFNPFDPDDIAKYWGEPRKAILAKTWMEQRGPLKNIRPDDKLIVIGAGETILAHSQEFIGGRNCVTTEMRARSSVGRIGITVCKCAGWGDLGFCNRWTMEVTNHLQGAAVVLVVGMRMPQIAFYEVDPLTGTYATGGGQYQTTDDLDRMMAEWTPQMMLPKFSRENY